MWIRRLSITLSLLLGVLLTLATAAPNPVVLQNDISWVNAALYSAPPGNVFNQTTLNNAIGGIAGNKNVLYLPTGTWTIGSSVTVPSNITLYIPAGTIISVSVGAVLTLATIPHYDQPHWFTGAGSLVITDATWPVDVRVYGAMGDGVTDDTTAITNAINAVSTNGGTVQFACGTYIVSSSITVLNGSGVRLLGASVSRGGDINPCAVLQYTASSSPLLWFDGTIGVEIGYLSLTYSSGTFGSTVLRLNQSSGTLPTRGVYVHDSSLFGTAGSSGTAAQLIYLDNVSDVTLERLNFGNANDAIVGAQTSAAAVINVRIRDCRFQTTLNNTAILGGGTGWVIEGNRFFPTASGAGLAFNTTNVGVTGLFYQGNVHFGTSSTGTSWFSTFNGPVNGGALLGNAFLDSSASSFCVRLGSSTGVGIIGNSLNCGSGVAGGGGNATYIMMMANSNGSTFPLNTYPGVGSLTMIGSAVGLAQMTLGPTGGAAGGVLVCYFQNTGQMVPSSSGTGCVN